MSARVFFSACAWRRAAAVVLLLCAFASLSRADTTQDVTMVPGADADVRLVVPGNTGFRRGFVPIRVRIANRAARERAWQLEIFDYGGYSGRQDNLTLTTAFSFSVGGGETREFVVFATVGSRGTGGGGPLSGRVRGPQVQGENFMLPLTWAGWSPMLPIATEPALEKTFETDLTLASTIRTGGRATRSGGSRRPTVAVSVFEATAWPADWRLWSAFSVVALRQETWQQLDEARRRALREWVAMGGRLLLAPAQAKPGRVERLGGGEIVTLSAPLPQRPDEALAKQLYEAPHGGSADWLADGAHWAWTPGSLVKPGSTGWLTYFVIAFGALVGPVNLFVFAPAGRRHRLLWTVPAISIGAAGILFGAIVLGDGFGGVGERRALVVLLPEQNHAVVVQRQISRVGLLGSRRFALPEDTVAEWAGDATLVGDVRRLVREGDSASGDWFVSRGVQQHAFRRLVPTRERIELTREADGTLVAQSTASAVLRDFVFCDEKAAYWTATEMPPGQRVRLQPVANADLPRTIVARAAARAPGVFYALADKSAIGLLPTLSSIRWQKDVVLYTGQLAVKEAKP